MLIFFHGGETGIRTLGAGCPAHRFSRAAPSTTRSSLQIDFYYTLTGVGVETFLKPGVSVGYLPLKQALQSRFLGIPTALTRPS